MLHYVSTTEVLKLERAPDTALLCVNKCLCTDLVEEPFRVRRPRDGGEFDKTDLVRQCALSMDRAYVGTLFLCERSRCRPNVYREEVTTLLCLHEALSEDNECYYSPSEKYRTPTVLRNERTRYRLLPLFHLWLEGSATRTHKTKINKLKKVRVTLPDTHVEEHLAAWAYVFIKVWKCLILGAVDHCTDSAHRVLDDGRPRHTVLSLQPWIIGPVPSVIVLQTGGGELRQLFSKHNAPPGQYTPWQTSRSA